LVISSLFWMHLGTSDLSVYRRNLASFGNFFIRDCLWPIRYFADSDTPSAVPIGDLGSFGTFGIRASSGSHPAIRRCHDLLVRHRRSVRGGPLFVNVSNCVLCRKCDQPRHKSCFYWKYFK
jgi:hypothetical protein